MMKLPGNALWSVPLFFFVVLAPLFGQSLEQSVERAQQEQAAGQYALAAADYATATRLEPGIAELWANRGLMEYLSGKTQESTESLHHALRMNPSLISPTLFLGKAYLDLGRPREAVPVLERARRLSPQDPRVLLALGKAYEGTGNWTAAAGVDGDAVTSDPKLASAWFALGVASLSLIDEQGRKLASLTSRSAWANALYADELMTQGRTSEAVARYQDLSKEASPQEAACLLRTVNHDIHGAPGSAQAKASEAITAALDAKAKVANTSCESEPAAMAYWRDDSTASAALAAQHLRTAPQAPEALYWSVKANEQRAVDALTQFQQLAPQSAASADLIGDLYRRRRQPDRALEQYQRALAIDPEDVVAWLGTSAAYFAAGQTQQSIEAARNGLQRQPDHPQLNLLMAEGLVANHQYDEAKAYLARSRPLPADLMVRMHALAGTVAAHDGDTATAITELAQALPGDEDGSLHYQIYRLYKRAGREHDAERAMAEVKSIEAQRRQHAVVAVHGTDGTTSE